MNIIVVEDDSLTALFIQETLEDLGHSVLGTFDNGATLFETISSLDVDLAFMDIEINGKMDGIECAKILKDDYKISSIFITSYQNSDTINDAMDSLPLGYLIKPVSEKEIEASLAVISKSLQTVTPKNPELLLLGNGEGKYVYNHTKKILTLNKELVKLSKNEYKVIDMLCKSYKNIVDTQDLIECIWEDSEGKEDSLRELIYRLRKKLPSLSINSLSKTGYYIK